jgi:hypothetical protein
MTVLARAPISTRSDRRQPDLRCPVCRAIDWRRDGFAISIDRPTGELWRRRIGISGRSEDLAWECRACGHALGPSLELARELNRLRVTHWE